MFIEQILLFIYRVYHKDIHPPYSQTGNRYDQTI